MATSSDISVLQNNDVQFVIGVLANGSALNLSGLSLTFYVKGSQTASDADAVTYTVGSGIVLTNPSGGICTVTVPRATNSASGTLWYRLDVNSSGVIDTVIYGRYIIGAV